MVAQHRGFLIQHKVNLNSSMDSFHLQNLVECVTNYIQGQKTVYYPHVSWFSTFSTSSFFRPKVIPKVLILGQFHTSVSQTVKSSVK